MRRFENILITAAAIAVGFSVMAYCAAGKIAPEAVTIPEVSNLENRYYEAEPALTGDSFFSGVYQNELDRFLADRVPLRDQIVLFNAGLQRTSVAVSALAHGYDVYPTFFGSRYYVNPRDNLIVDRAEEVPSEEGMHALDAWVETLNQAAQQHPDVHFVYDCIARHDQTEANPTYRYYDNRLNPSWVQEHFIDRLDPSIDAFIDSVESYDEICEEWLATDPHWTMERALKSYNRVAEQMGLAAYPYNDPIEVMDSWYGGYANSGLDWDIPIDLKDLPIDFSNLSFNNLPEDGGGTKYMGMRESVLSGDAELENDGASKYYEYFGGGSMVATNTGTNNGRTVLFIGDSLSYCLTRFIASNYSQSVFLLPGNSRFDDSLDEYLQRYNPDDVIIMMHASKYQMIAEYSPRFMGLE